MKKRYKALLAAMLTGALAAGCLAGCGKWMVLQAEK